MLLIHSLKEWKEVLSEDKESLPLKWHFTWALKKGLFSHNSVFLL
jgi:hypothetical protein